MRFFFKYFNLMMFTCLLFFTHLSFGQDMVQVDNKKDKGEPGETPCERYSNSEYFGDKIKLIIDPDINKTAFYINQLQVSPIFAPGISVRNFEYSAKIIEPQSGQEIDFHETLIAGANSSFLDSNGRLELEIKIKGIYSYNPSLYNGSNPLVFEFLLFGHKLDPLTEDFTIPFNSDIIYDPETIADCEEDENYRIAQNYIKNLATIYPNPSNGNFVLQTQLEADMPISIEIFNSLGQKILVPNKSLTLDNEFRNFKISLWNYPDGIYYLKILRNNTTQLLKIIKSN